MLKELVQLLTRDLTGRTWTEELEHPFLGKMLLIASKTKPNSYCETAVELGRGRIEAFVNAPDRSPPSDAQVTFAREFLADLDRSVGPALPLVAERYRDLYGRRLPRTWRATLRRNAFEVPAGGDPTNPWSPSLDATGDSAGHVFTCYFEGGRPANVTADG